MPTGITNPPGNPAYNASKAAVKSLAESLAHSLIPTKVSAHLLVPGYTYTKLTTGGGAEGEVDASKKPEAAWTAAQVSFPASVFRFHRSEQLCDRSPRSCTLVSTSSISSVPTVRLLLPLLTASSADEQERQTMFLSNLIKHGCVTTSMISSSSVLPCLVGIRNTLRHIISTFRKKSESSRCEKCKKDSVPSITPSRDFLASKVSRRLSRSERKRLRERELRLRCESCE